MYHDPRLENRYHAWLLIKDFECLPKEITKQIGLEPTITRIKGEYRTVGKKKRVRLLNKNNSWVLESDLPSATSLEEQIKYLLEKIEPYRESIISLSKKYTVEFNTAIYYYEANPGFKLDKALIKKINQLNMGIYFDIYCLAGALSQFEYPEAEEELTKQFSKVTQIVKFNQDKHNEAKILAKSLIGIDKSVHNLEMYLEDLIWDDLSENLYKETFGRVNENLRNIAKNIENSKYLTSEVKK
jgi:hypothetical protein